MKYPNMTWSRMEAIINKLGGERGVEEFLSGASPVKQVKSLLKYWALTPYISVDNYMFKNVLAYADEKDTADVSKIKFVDIEEVSLVESMPVASREILDDWKKKAVTINQIMSLIEQWRADPSSSLMYGKSCSFIVVGKIGREQEKEEPFEVHASNVYGPDAWSIYVSNNFSTFGYRGRIFFND